MSNYSESDEWGTKAPNIMDGERLAAIKQALEQTPVIVEHWHFYGSCAPDRMVFEDFEEFETYLKTKTIPGDSLWLWRFDELCRDDNPLTHGKCPNAEGLVPLKGAY